MERESYRRVRGRRTTEEAEFQVGFQQTFSVFERHCCGAAPGISILGDSSSACEVMKTFSATFRRNMDGIFRAHREVARDGPDNSASGIMKVFSDVQSR